TRSKRDWSSDVCSSDLENSLRAAEESINFIDENTRVTILNVVGADDVKDEVLHGSQSGNVTTRRKEKLSQILDFYDGKGIIHERSEERRVGKERRGKMG